MIVNIFTATNGTAGYELWLIDGQGAVTPLLDIYPGPGSSNITGLLAANGVAYFTAFDGTQTALWRTDGTLGGTYAISDGAQGGGAFGLTNVNGTLFFLGSDDTHGSGLFKTGGTLDSTEFVATVQNANGFRALGDKLLFQATDPVAGNELWVSDGTQAGTYRLMDIAPGFASSNIANQLVVGSKLFFTADNGAQGNELWVSDGTAAGTHQVRDIYFGASGSQPANLFQFGDKLLFEADDGVHGRQLWSSDGTDAGTGFITSALNGTPAGHYAAFKGKLYFSGFGPDGYGLFASDGTLAGETFVAAGLNIQSPLFVAGDKLFFAANNGLFASDGTAAGTVSLGPLNPSYGTLAGAIVAGDKLFFVNTMNDGSELWVSDGSAAGTHVVKDINPGFYGSDPIGLTAFGTKVVFSAFDPVNGREVWISDGTSDGTKLLRDIYPSGDKSAALDPDVVTAVGGIGYFVGNDPSTGRELYATDSGTGATQLLKDIAPGAAGSNPQIIGQLAGKLFFTAQDLTGSQRIWASDGTAGGTVALTTASGGVVTGTTTGSAILNGKLYFSASSPDGIGLYSADISGSVVTYVSAVAPSGHIFAVGDKLIYGGSTPNGWQLASTDGTAGGTTPLISLDYNRSEQLLNGAVEADSNLFFVKSDQNGTELWVSDGTVLGTHIVRDINPEGFSSSPASLTAVGNQVLFTADSPALGREVWISDGTEAGTHLLADINQTSNPAPGMEPGPVTRLGSLAFFVGRDPAYGDELYVTDGTTNVTTPLKDIVPGVAAASPEILGELNGKLYFSAQEPSGSRHLWATDGTTAGTYVVTEANAAIQRSASATVWNGKLYFVGNGAAGTGLYATDGTVGGESLIYSAVDISSSLFVVGGKLMFSAYNDGLIASDGTPQGSASVISLSLNTGHYHLTGATVAGSLLFFVKYSPVTGAELWTSDGTAGGTHLVVQQGGPADPLDLTALGSKVLFTAFDPATGRELWISDGTSAGTHPLAEINQTKYSGTGLFPGSVTAAGNLGYFTGSDPVTGNELYVTDSTTGATHLLEDLVAGVGGSNPQVVGQLGGRQVFTALNAGGQADLWITDGTSAGTYALTSASVGTLSGSTSYAIANGKIYFGGTGPNGLGLYASDGTAGGETVIATGFSIATMFAVGSRLIFSAWDGHIYSSDGMTGAQDLGLQFAGIDPRLAGAAVAGQQLFYTRYAAGAQELWVSDGTVAGTHAVSALTEPIGSFGKLVPVGDKLFFTLDDPVTGKELVVTDGTTSQMFDILQGPNSSSVDYLTPFNGKLYFVANNGVTGPELWVSDGTQAGTTVLKDIVPGESGSNASGLFVMNGVLYFAANDGVNGPQIWKSDGTELGTDRVGGAQVIDLGSVFVGSTKFYFIGSDQTHTYSVFVSDGTAGGTHYVMPYYDGRLLLGTVNDTLYFSFDDGQHGRELWSTNGTTPVMLTDAATPNGAAASQFITLGDKVYFSADNGSGYGVYAADGQGTITLIKGVDPQYPSSPPTSLMTAGGKLYFSALDQGENWIWQSDGTVAGTVKVSRGFALMGEAGGRVFFIGQDFGYGLYSSDGTPGGTQLVLAANSVAALGSVGGRLYFTVYGTIDGRELWSTDGTAAGTLQLTHTGIPNGSDASQMLTIGSQVFFTANDGVNGIELYVANGGSVTRLDILPGAGSANPTSLIAFGGKAYFAAYDGSGTAIWVSDGTAAGTSRIASGYGPIISADGHIFYSVYGSGLYASDGTAAGTHQVFASAANLTLLGVAGDKAYFSFADPVDGRELWSSDGTPAGTVQVTDTAVPYSSNPTNFLTLNLDPAIAYTPSTSVLSEAGVTAGNSLTAGVDHAVASVSISSQVPGVVVSYDLAGWTVVSAAAYTRSGTYGTLQLDTATGQLDYTLDNMRSSTNALKPGDHVTDSFMIAVQSATGETNAVNVSFVIDGANDRPVITSPAAATVVTGTATALPGLSFSDPEAASQTFAVTVTADSALIAMQDLANGASLTGSGTAHLQLQGTFAQVSAELATLSVTAAADDTLQVTVADSAGGSSTTQVQVHPVAQSNHAPEGTASALFPSGTEDVAYTLSDVDLLAGFTDADGDAISVIGLSANHGTVTDNGNGTFTITPATNYNGLVSLSYSVTDGHGGSSSASQSFGLAPVNDTPTGSLLISGTPLEGEGLYANISIDDPDGYFGGVYQWLRDGVPVEGANGGGYGLTQADVGSHISLRLTYTDGGGTVEIVTTAPTAAVMNANEAPTLTGPIALTRQGQEFLVNTQSVHSQEQPVVAGLADGRFIAVWKDGNSSTIKAQLYAADGNRIGGEQIVNTEYADGQPTVSALAGGGFAVSWQTYQVPGGGYDIKAQLFDTTGGKVGGEFYVNTITQDYQEFPSIAGLATGGFVVTWQDSSGTLGDSSDWSIKAQLFDAVGGKVGSEFLVNTLTEGPQQKPAVTGLANGGFAISWQGGTQLFDAAGAKVAGQLPTGALPGVAGLANGTFVVTWQDSNGSLGDGSQEGIKAQLYDAQGVPVGNTFQVNTQLVGSQVEPVVAATASGGFVISWVDVNPVGDGDGTSIKAQAFDASGATIGGEIVVDTHTASDQVEEAITGLADGRMVVVWRTSDPAQDGDGFAVKGQVLAFTPDALHVDVQEDTPSASIAIGAVDIDNDLLAYAVKPTAGPTLGTVAFAQQAGTFTYTPNADANGTDHFTIVVSDGHGGAVERDVIVSIAAVNDAPTVANLAGDTVTVIENQGTKILDLGFDALLSDSDSADFMGGSLRVAIASGLPEDVLFVGDGLPGLTATGSAVFYQGVQFATYTGGSQLDQLLHGGAPLVFSFNANATLAAVQALLQQIGYANALTDNPTAGTRSVDWTLVDGDGTANGGHDTLTFTTSLNVVAVNDPPSGTDKTVAINEDSRYVFSWSDFGYSDPDNSPHPAVQFVTVPTQGTLYMDTDGPGGSLGTPLTAGSGFGQAGVETGWLVYVPAPDSTASVSFSFRAFESGGGAQAAASNTFTFNINPVNDAPFVQHEITDRGWVEDFGGPDAIVYFGFPEDSFADVDGDALTYSAALADGSPLPSWLNFDAPGQAFSARLPENFNGVVSIRVTASDASLSVSDVFDFTVTPVNDLPTGSVSISGTPNLGQQLTASNTLADVDGLGTISYQWLRDGSAILGAVGSNYMLVQADVDMHISVRASYTDGWGTAESVTSTATDAVTNVNTAPEGLDSAITLAEDTSRAFTPADFGFSDADAGDTLFAVYIGAPSVGRLVYEGTTFPAGGYMPVSELHNLTYEPPLNASGDALATLSFNVVDSSGSDTRIDETPATLTINVIPVNDPPMADIGSTDGGEDTLITGAVRGTDPDGDSLSFALVAGPQHGQVQIAGDGTFTYTPDANYFGIDSFVFRASDGTANSDPQVFSITMLPDNSDPAIITGDLAASISESAVPTATDGVVSGQLSAADPDGPTNFTATSLAGTYGNFAIGANGAWTYTLDENATATQALKTGQNMFDSFTVSTADGTQATVAITVHGADDATLFGGQLSGTVAEAALLDTPTQVTGTLTATDPDGGLALTAQTVSGQYGTLQLAANGQWTYILDNANLVVDGLSAGETLADSVTVTAVDGTTRALAITIAGANDIRTGGDGDDILTGTAGTDIINGNGGNDLILGGGGNDTLNGGDGNDTLSGFGGLTEVYGGNGDDTFIGPMSGYVFVSGGTGYNTLDYSQGSLGMLLQSNDPTRISGYLGLYGGQVLAAAEGISRVIGTVYGDTMRMENYGAALNLLGGDGNDTITATSHDDTIAGGSGNDVIDGGIGLDIAVFTGVAADYSVTRNVDGSVSVVDLRAGLPDGSDYLTNVEILRFSNGDVSLVNRPTLFGGQLSGTVAESAQQGGASQVTGTLTATDPDGGTALAAQTVAGQYGTLQLAANGAWTYVLNNANPVVDGLSAGASLGDAVTITAVDGTTQNIAITITGTNDIRTGGNGNDNLIGTAGNDTFNGGNGTDTADYSNVAAGVTVNLGLTAAQNTGGGGTDTLISIENLTGTDQGDTLIGAAGANRLDGGAGNDTIDGGAGADTLLGGTGIDTASFASATSGVTVSLAAQGAAQNTGAGNDTLTGFENLNGSNFADALTGDGAANLIDGGIGNDTLAGGAGDDTLIGGAGLDTVTYAAATAAVVASLTSGTASGGAGNDQLIGIENLTGSNFNDTLAGDGGANTLNGGTGIDTVSYASTTAGVTVSLAVTAAQNTVGAGIDTLTAMENVIGSTFADRLTGSTAANVIDGGAGDDTIDGGTGADTLIGGTGIDTLSYASAGSAVAASLLTGTASGGGGADTVQGFENLTGSASNDVLTGDTGANLILGGLGNDTLSGGLGSDTLNGEAGTDTATYAVATGAVSVSLLTGLATGADGIDTLVAIENVTGSAFGDTLTGDDNANVLTGGDGNDILAGGAGNDTLAGGNGADTATYASATAGVTVSLAVTAAQKTGGAGSDVLSGIENLTGSGFADTLTGGGGANVLDGGGGADRLNGGAGADTLTGGAEADVFVFGIATDSTPTSRDLITDFAQGTDRIDLTGIDAVPGGAHNAFLWSGTAPTARGIWYTYDVASGVTHVYGDTNGNAATIEFQLDLVGQYTLVQNDFLL